MLSTVGPVIVCVSNRAFKIKGHVVVADANLRGDEFPALIAKGGELIDCLPSFDEFVFPLLHVKTPAIDPSNPELTTKTQRYKVGLAIPLQPFIHSSTLWLRVLVVKSDIEVRQSRHKQSLYRLLRSARVSSLKAISP